jgi:kojibiose phosphorylase
MRYRFRPEQDAELTLATGIDGRVWSLSGERFKAYSPFTQDDLIGVETITGEFGIQIDVVEAVQIVGAQPSVEIVQVSKSILRRLTFHLDADEEVSVEKVVAIYTSNDVPNPRERAISDARTALSVGYQALREAHQSRWDEIRERCSIEIDGNLEDQTTARFNLYHNIIAKPTHADLPIGARGLSCQVYQGAAFWGQEIFNMPMFLYTQPDVARSVLKYRYDTLDGARGKARRLGYYGAFYAWTSGKTGEELFPDHFFTNVVTGRKVRNHFDDWQIHITSPMRCGSIAWLPPIGISLSATGRKSPSRWLSSSSPGSTSRWTRTATSSSACWVPTNTTRMWTATLSPTIKRGSHWRRR